MRQFTESQHYLQMRENANRTWRKPIAGMFRPAVLLAYQGRLVEAIELAETIQIENCGHMNDVCFRVVSKTVTATTVAGPWDESVYRVIE